MEWTLQNSVTKENLNDFKKVSRAPTTLRLSGVGKIKGNRASKRYSYAHVRFWALLLVLRADFKQANHTRTTAWLGQAQLAQWSSLEVALGDLDPRKGCQWALCNPQIPQEWNCKRFLQSGNQETSRQLAVLSCLFYRVQFMALAFTQWNTCMSTLRQNSCNAVSEIILCDHG